MKIKLLRHIPIKDKKAIKKDSIHKVKRMKEIFPKKEVYVIKYEGKEVGIFPNECEELNK